MRYCLAFYCYIHLTIFHVNMVVLNSFWIYCMRSLLLSAFYSLNLNNKLKTAIYAECVFFFLFNLFVWPFRWYWRWSVLLLMSLFVCKNVGTSRKKEKKLRRKKTHFLCMKSLVIRADTCAQHSWHLYYSDVFVWTMADDLECVRLCGINQFNVKV